VETFISCSSLVDRRDVHRVSAKGASGLARQPLAKGSGATARRVHQDGDRRVEAGEGDALDERVRLDGLVAGSPLSEAPDGVSFRARFPVSFRAVVATWSLPS